MAVVPFRLERYDTRDLLFIVAIDTHRGAPPWYRCHCMQEQRLLSWKGKLVEINLKQNPWEMLRNIHRVSTFPKVGFFSFGRKNLYASCCTTVLLY